MGNQQADEGASSFLCFLRRACASLGSFLLLLCHASLRAMPSALQTQTLALLPLCLLEVRNTPSVHKASKKGARAGRLANSSKKGINVMQGQITKTARADSKKLEQNQHRAVKVGEMSGSDCEKNEALRGIQAKETGKEGDDQSVLEVPRHVGIIMDGNRRYGRAVHGVATQGHADGGKTLDKVVDWCIELGVEVLTVYAFSTENWNRDPEEITCLMTLFAKNAKQIQDKSVERNIRVRVLASDPAMLPEHIQEAFFSLEKETASCNGFQLNLCVSYGSRSEIVRACRLVAQKVKDGELTTDQIGEEMLSGQMLTAGLPDPDLLIRTSGERRLSNFLLWQLAYAEMVFVEKPWPALERVDLIDVLREYSRRKRRFGK
eukprot:gb/GEZN01006741.1/.p1 GENE.gb/GEZN01006741.1/~~gb/GEZN01006741.1/.p1  ORF type:complete len:377 (+),score=61.09 gb/GEZN01006741.1/:107-1237(+)